MRKCSGCGKWIRWGVTAAGKAHPFDERTTLVMLEDGTVHTGRVSHFATCPQAREFSKGKEPERRNGHEG